MAVSAGSHSGYDRMIGQDIDCITTRNWHCRGLFFHLPKKKHRFAELAAYFCLIKDSSSVRRGSDRLYCACLLRDCQGSESDPLRGICMTTLRLALMWRLWLKHSNVADASGTVFMKLKDLRICVRRFSSILFHIVHTSSWGSPFEKEMTRPLQLSPKVLIL